MGETLSKEADGVALAAPQVGAPLRLFIVTGKVMGQDTPKVFINPELVKRARKKQEMEEGCLSLRWLYGKVKRSARVTVEAYDEEGKKFSRGAGGLLAQIFQHEIDHLNGRLFIDTATDVVNIPPPTPQ
jgi:peptide deformylase